MKTTKLLRTLIIAAGIAAGGLATAADNGNVYQILPCNADGATVEPYATLASPLTSGETVYFNLRLIQKTRGDRDTSWYPSYDGLGSSELAELMFPMQIGIYVSGQLRYATLVNWSCDPAKNYQFTDLIFSYKTEPGDFALPIVLAVDDPDSPTGVSPATASNSGSAYHLNAISALNWSIKNDAGNTCNLWHWSQEWSTSSGDDRSGDFTLASAGLYVKTIDFDSRWEVADSIWRSVHQDSTITVGPTPTLVATSASSNAVTLHVWSMDESVVRVKGGRTVQLVTSIVGDTTNVVETQVADVVIAGGQVVSDPFLIEGVALSNTCNLVLSAWDHYNFDSLNNRLGDFLTVPVKSIEPMPPTIMVESSETVVYADSNYKLAKATLSVRMSQSYSNDVQVAIRTKFADGSTDLDWGDYVRFSKNDNNPTALPDGGAGHDPVVTIPAESTEPQQVFVFFLRSDEHTAGGASQINFTPEIVDNPVATADFGDNLTAAGVEVRSAAPVIDYPKDTTKVNGVAGEASKLQVNIKDDYADMMFFDPTGVNGYKVSVKATDYSAVVELPGVYYVGAGGQLLLVKDDGTGTFFKSTEPPTITYPSDASSTVDQPYVSYVEVKSPITGEVAGREFFSVVAKKRSSELAVTSESMEFYEGDKVPFKVTLSQAYEQPIYAFLRTTGNIQGMFREGTCVVCDDTDLTKTQGQPINEGQLETAQFLVQVLDGYNEDIGGLQLQFQVEFCTTPQYDPSTKLNGYRSNFVNIFVYNLEPTIKRLELNGFESEMDGFTFPNKMPKGMTQRIKAKVTDKGAYDLKIDEDGKRFKTKWTCYLNGAAKYNVEKEGDPDDDANRLEYNFPASGMWTVKCQVKDKDMDDYSEVTYSVNIEVLDNPLVEVIAPENVFENDTKQKVQIQASYWDTDYYGTLTARVEVVEYSPGKPNAGFLKLDSAYASQQAGEENVYYVELRDSNPVDLIIEAMDGTDVSSTYGFKVTAEIVSDAVLPTSGTAANEYYIQGMSRVFVDNVAPVCVVTPADENTNRWEVAGGAATTRAIRWQVKNDVDNDFSFTYAQWPEAGVKVTFAGCDNATEFMVTEPSSGTFVPNFGSSQGDIDVTLTIEDKDHGAVSWTWHFTVTPSKILETIANGPSGGVTSSRLSQKYALLEDGIGMGHVYVPDAVFSGANNFILSWNCGKATDVKAYAFGYKVANPDDNGMLNGGYDRAIDPSGYSDSTVIPEAKFHYPFADMAAADKKDSFFYCWLLHTRGENDNTMTTIYLDEALAPERPATPGMTDKLGYGIIPLPKEQTEDKSYLKTTVEAVFSREWLPEDNLGDINQDGVPDYFAIREWGNGNLIQLKSGGGAVAADAGNGNNANANAGASITANDLTDLANENPDGDALPGYYTQDDLAAIVENSQNSYAPVGVPLNTKFEIRGFHDGLNAIDCTTSDISFSDVEQLAWEAYAEENGLDAATPDLSIWSPEPRGKMKRMDPTLEDTDADYFPDGWEYFFWYQAHVWVPARVHYEAVNGELTDDDRNRFRFGLPRQGTLQRFVFERFDITNPMHGIEIPPADVEAHFNPCEPFEFNILKESAYPDFDHDGLSDLEELAIGTNPCHWDTDGDGICDGYEVMMLLDPQSANDRSSNGDGDWMAVHLVADDYVYLADGNDAIGSTMYGIITSLQVLVDVDMQGNTLQDLTVEAYKFTAKEDRNNAGANLYYGELFPDENPPTDCGWGRRMVDEVEYVRELFIPSGTSLKQGLDFVLVHDQVQRAFTFDPRTGWSGISDGYVADRWNPAINTALSPFDEAGYGVNTGRYYSYDEYLVMMYRYQYDITYPDENAQFRDNNVMGTIIAKTTNPSAADPDSADDGEAEAGEGEAGEGGETAAATTDQRKIADYLAQAFSEAYSTKTPVVTHGADTDQDGVPDGWELYTYRCPNARFDALGDESGSQTSAIPGSYDGDQLTYVQEYAGTDSCNVHKDCSSVYQNHPGNRSGWFNKFFPTNPGDYAKYGSDGDPDSQDTDGDGIVDHAEGTAWGADFYNGGNVYADVRLGFVYGEPEDSLTCCIRGAGMNPCTVDTDFDGLPDGWEMAHAGVPVDLATLNVVAPRGGNVANVQIADATLAGDGFTRGGSSGREGVYIAGGMDATWGGDACTSDTRDDLVGIARDVDFDHDGLQNYQEYLIQAVRHFRYDDISTPLMGRQLQEGQYNDDNQLEAPHEQQFCGFVPMSADDPEAFATAAAEAWDLGDYVLTVTETTGTRVTTRTLGDGSIRTNINYITRRVKKLVDGDTLVHAMVANTDGTFSQPWTADGWRKLGYFAPPVHSWDSSITRNMIDNPMFLFPAIGQILDTKKAAGYVSTDPRMADTDGDGMDDYYEMFHGLNPLLGNTAEEPGSSNYDGGKRGDIISAVYGMINDPLVDTKPYFNAFWNEWTHPDYNHNTALNGQAPTGGDDPAAGQNTFNNTSRAEAIGSPEAFDPILYPWVMGSPMVDADGDGLRNDEERIVANVADPLPHHTDPTPAWFTERTTPVSYVAQYYVTCDAVGRMSLANGPGGSASATRGSTSDYMYAFEENEGYDTDNDFVPDSREVVSPTLAPVDPLRFDTPDRRQALYLDGVDSYALSKEMQYRGEDAVDLLKQFTVECWICPEKSGVAQTVIDRAVAVPGSSIDKDKMAIRSNFRIGIAPSGAVYGMYDNNDSIESGYNQPISCQRVDGKILPLNKWSHVALTYNGSELAIYVNGQLCRKAATTLVPANGVDRIMQAMDDLVGLSNQQYYFSPCAFIIGARPQKENEYAFYPVYVEDDEHKESFDNLQEYFQGYVDEVRVWDGARSAEEIEANYLHRMTFEEVAANREAVYNGWINNATRNNNDNADMLPPELVMHYNFASLAGAVEPSKVAQAPIGFMDKTLGAAQFSYDEADNADITLDGLYANIKELKGGTDGEVLWTDDDGNERALEIGWWMESRVHSLVYRNYNYVPWIQNTVAHLPRFDGASPDSFYYGEKRAASYSIPSDVGFRKVLFPNGADPYPYIVYNLERAERLFTADRLVEVRGQDFQDYSDEARFQYRNNFIGSSDLVPLGHAYAKTTTNFWDGAASDPWEYTDEDSDANGLPDWWEIYARENYCKGVLGVDEDLNWDTYINYKNLQIPAWQAYMIDLNRGMQPGGQVDPAYAATYDSDRDGIPDWWEKMFGVFEYGADDDTDGDGLSNYAEYLLSEVFDLGVVFDPANAFSVSFYDSDYFYKIGDLYAGEVFTDHDMMEDAWELKRGHGYVNSLAWDADSDNDEDRWSAFAECRYNTFSANIVADNITHVDGDVELKDFPIPTLKLTLRYNQSQPLASAATGNSLAGGDNGEQNALAPIVVKTFTYKATQEINMVPDATFNIQPGVELERIYDLGGYSDRVARGTLTPGYIEPDSFTIETAQVAQNNSYTWTLSNVGYMPVGEIVGTMNDGNTVLMNGTYGDYVYYYNKYGQNRVTLQYEGFAWSELGTRPGDVIVTQDNDSNEGYICLGGERIGTLNRQTGEFAIDMSSFGNTLLNATNSTFSLKEAIFRISYKSRIPVLQSNKLSLFLGAPNVGAVREGRNRIVAFYDLNNDGNYTPGEPMGFANDVEVGWYQGACDLELTDTSPVITRADLSQIASGSGGSGDAIQNAISAITGGGAGGSGGASDRHVLYGTEDGDIVDLIVGELSGGAYQRIRIVRTLINGWGIQDLGVANRVVVDKWMELDQRPFFFEGDVLENGAFDLDWNFFQDEVVNNPNVRASGIDPTEVTYRIVLGNGSIETDATNNLYSIATVRHFDTTAARPTPTTIAPGLNEAVVYGARPTFKWRLGPVGTIFNSYPAFRIQVMNQSGTVVWDSGIRRTPAMDLDGVYKYTPDVYAGDQLRTDQKYTWRVSMYNAKFRNDKWSDRSPAFQMFTQEDVHGYGSIDVCVKYFGPANVLSSGAVRVEAFDTPDFTGFPAARTYVSNKSSVSAFGVEHVANAKLVGLDEGTYYVRAYIDISSTNGTSYAKDSWESWGYVCPREVNPAFMFSPTAIEVGSESAAMRTYTLYIEDVDTNGNCLPDAWEMLRSGRLGTGASSAEVIGDATVTSDSLAGGLSGKVNADHVASRLASQVFAAVYAADGASLLTNVGVSDPNGTYSGAMAAAAANAQAEIEDVKVTALSVAGGKVVLKVEGESVGATLLTASQSSTVVKKTYDYTARIQYTDDLASGSWQTATRPVSITVYSDGRAETSEIDLSELANGDKCFFKVSFE